MDATSGGVPPRTEDLFRHLDDLRTNPFEGAGPRAERIELFRRAVELLGPVMRPVLDEANAALLDGTGELSKTGRPSSRTAAGSPAGSCRGRSSGPRPTSAAGTASRRCRWSRGSPPAFWRILEGGWRIVPGYTRRSGRAGQ
jgi:hypothetical protein